MKTKNFCILAHFVTFLVFCNSIAHSEFLNANEFSNWKPIKELESQRNKRDVLETSSANVTSKNVSETKIDDQRLLGVNGTGQRKDYASSTEPIMAANISTTKQLLGSITSSDSILGEYPADSFPPLDNVDQPDEDTNNTLLNNNITKFEEDSHIYYNSTITINKDQAQQKWKEITSNLTISNLLSKSHRRAMTIQLSFDFPFYGHPVRNVTVATGGFLYTGDHVHSWLAATQYIAPLMANFDTSLSNDSFVKYSDDGVVFTVLWENVKLQDRDEGTFTFSASLYKTGDIIFAYYSIPISIISIQDDKHPVKVGLSDAYIIDKTIFFARRKTIYEYHRVSFAYEQVQNNTIIELKMLPSCLSFKDCKSCTDAKLNLKCRWCPAINRCSTGTDRRRQEWMHKGCDNLKIEDSGQCPALGAKGNNYNATVESDLSSDSDRYNTTDFTQDVQKTTFPAQGSSRINDRKLNLGGDAETNQLSLVNRDKKLENTAEGGIGTVLGFFIPFGLVLTIICWVFYAYRNPHTKSGQLLIQYRPSQWSWRRGEARYTAATIHM